VTATTKLENVIPTANHAQTPVLVLACCAHNIEVIILSSQSVGTANANLGPSILVTASVM
jgi:hypothetical protein